MLKTAAMRLEKVNWALVFEGLALIAKGVNGSGSPVESQSPRALMETQAASGEAKEKGFVFVDLETTGFSPRLDAILEIGAIKVEASSSTVQEFHALVNPERPIPRAAARIHGITDAMVVGKPNITKIFPLFLEFIGSFPLVAHNAAFDLGFLRYNAEKCGVSLTNNHICTLELARSKLPDLPNHKLGTIADHFKIPNKQAHRALSDCDIGLSVFRRLIELK